MPIEKENFSQEDYLGKAAALLRSKAPQEDIARLAEDAENNENFEAAIRIRDEMLGENSDKVTELRMKSAEQDMNRGWFKRAAETLWVAKGADSPEVRGVAERAVGEQKYEDAIYIYRDILADYEKMNEALDLLSKQLEEKKEYFNAANVLYGKEKDISVFHKIAERADADNRPEDAVRIYEEILDDNGDVRREFRRKWSKKEEDAGNFYEAAVVLEKIKDRPGISQIAERAKATGKLHDAVLIYEEVLREWNPETTALRKQLEESEEQEFTAEENRKNPE